MYFESKGNDIATVDMTERQAKEMDNVHTNRREFAGNDGGPIEVSDMTDEQIEQRVAALMLLALEEDEERPAANGPEEADPGVRHRRIEADPAGSVRS